MAPTKSLKGITSKAPLLPLARKGISTRSQNVQDQNSDPIVTRGKRKADISPLKNDKIKRSALGNLTNNVVKLNLDEENKNLTKVECNANNKKSVNILKAKDDNGNGNPPPPSQPTNYVVTRPHKILTRAAAKNALSEVMPSVTTVIKAKETCDLIKPTTRRISNEFEKTEDSLYMSALEDISSSSIRFSGNFDKSRRSQHKNKLNIGLSITLEDDDDSKHLYNRILTPSPLKYPQSPVPEGIVDFDKENWDDPFQASHYAMDIFNYLKNRESQFIIDDYMPKQVHLCKWMRSLLVDWMVEVQETFELNHETLYLAVKLVDMYLCKIVVLKDKLQLLGAAALFIACKFDERTPPVVEDFLYICDGAYSHNELIKMEKNVLITINFDLGIPLSYRFLRRYARCTKVPLPILTLARYILEYSLMDYGTIKYRDSQIACATLFMALRMNGKQNPWSKTLEYYTGYKLEEFAYIVPILNNGLQRRPKDTMKTIRNKYSHKIFYEVAKTPLMSTEKIFEHTGLMKNN